MKKLFLSMAAVAMLASCSNDEIVEQAQEQKAAIGFKTFVDKSTRGIANDITTDGTNGTTTAISNFSVWGFMESINGTVFTDESVTLNSNKWGYTNTQYWTGGKTYYFSAIAPTTARQWSYTADAVAGGKITFENSAGTQDLLYESKTLTCDEDPSKQNEVDLTFEHLLSRVKFEFTNGLGNTNITLDVKNVTITNAVNKASIDMAVANPVWTPLPSGENLTNSLNFGNAEDIAKSSSVETDHLYMIPQNQTYTLNFTVEMYQGTVLAETFTHTAVTVPQVNMELGHSYIFSTTLTAESIVPGDDKLHPIEFTVTKVEKWDTFGTGGSF